MYFVLIGVSYVVSAGFYGRERGWYAGRDGVV
jgi:hypothetical protein